MKRKSLDIMIIDDDPVFTKLLEKFLFEHVDCTVISFENVRVCLNSRPPEPKIVFLDYYMDDLDGLRATRLLKKRWKNAVYILISSSNRITEKRVSRFGVDLAIPKDEGVEQIVSLALKYRNVKRMIGLTFRIVLLIALLCAIGLLFYFEA